MFPYIHAGAIPEQWPQKLSARRILTASALSSEVGIPGLHGLRTSNVHDNFLSEECMILTSSAVLASLITHGGQEAIPVIPFARISDPCWSKQQHTSPKRRFLLTPLSCVQCTLMHTLPQYCRQSELSMCVHMQCIPIWASKSGALGPPGSVRDPMGAASRYNQCDDTAWNAASL